MNEKIDNLKASTEGKYSHYRAVVEDNQDPLKLGRVKVRIIGVHSEDKNELPTESLPWAEVLGGTEFGLISGKGLSGVPLQGSYVWIFFDGGDENAPVVFGTTKGLRKKMDVISFCDKDGQFPINSRLGYPDYNFLATGENQDLSPMNIKSQDPIVQEPFDNYKKGIYPHNRVIETESGNIIELDDTDGNERIQIFHNSGTLIELLPDGKLVIKSVQDSFEIVQAHKKIHISGNKTEQIDGNNSINIKGNLDINVSGNINITAGGALNIKGTNGNIITSSVLNIKALPLNLN